MLAGADGALELRAFAAPRNGDLWSEVRPQIAADMVPARRHRHRARGPVRHRALCQIQVQRPEGQTAVQPSRIVGINGPRWLLRATLLGRPALEPDARRRVGGRAHPVAVRRGDHAMPVGEPLPLVLPDARPPRRPRRRRPEDPAVAEKSRLRRTISRWANTTDQHARDLRRTHVRVRRCTAIGDAPDRDDGHAARHAAHRDAAPARRRAGARGRALRRLRRAHRGVAGPAPDRRHRPGSSLPVQGRIGVHDGVRIIYNPRYELLP